MLPKAEIERHLARVRAVCETFPEVVVRPGQHHAFLVRGKTFAYFLVDHHGDGRVAIQIEDDGPGFSAEVLDWLGEPFLSTRRHEGGLGLGIFIANTLLARTGARLHFDNTARGARVSMVWPPESLRSGSRGADA